PNRHPHSRLGGFVALRAERHLDIALTTSPLTVLAQEDLAFTGADSAEGRRIAPVPSLFPAELLEPCKALANIGDVQDRGQSLGQHSAILPRKDLMGTSGCPDP